MKRESIQLPQLSDGTTYMTCTMMEKYPELRRFYEATKSSWYVDLHRDLIIMLPVIPKHHFDVPLDLKE